MAILYESYAKEKGFNPIKAPDKSEKIRIQGLQQMSYMKEELAWNNKQAALLDDTFTKNAEITRQNREDNFKLRQSNRDTLAKAKWKQFERKVKNAEIRQKNRDQALNDLLNVTESGAKLFAQLEGARKKKVMSEWHQFADENGISSIDVAQAQAVENHAWKEGWRNTKIGREFVKRGYSDEIANKIRSASGYQSLAISHLTAQTTAREWKINAYYKQRNTPINLGGNEVTFDTAKASGNPVTLRAVMRELDKRYRDSFGDNWFSNKVWERSGAYGIKDAHVTGIMQKQAGVTEKQSKEQAVDDRRQSLDFEMNRRENGQRLGAKGAWNWLTLQAGEGASREDKVAAMNLLVSDIQFLSQTGGLSQEMVNDLLDLYELPVIPSGSTKEVKFGEHFKPQWSKIENAVINNQKIRTAMANADAAEHRINGQNFLNDVQDIIAKENPSPEWLQKNYTHAVENGWLDAANTIQRHISLGTTQLNDKTAVTAIRGRIARHEHITPEELDILAPSAGVRAQLLSEINKHNILLPGKGHREFLDDRIKQELEKIIPSKSSFQSNSTRSEATSYAQSEAYRYYKEARIQGKSPEQAYKDARDFITQDIRDPDGMWGRTSPDGMNGTREFKGFTADVKRDKYPAANISQMKEELAANPNLVFSKGYINRSDLEAKAGKLNKGANVPILPQARVIASNSGINALDAEVAQIEYHRNKEIAETGATTLQQYPDWYIKKVKDTYERLMPSPAQQRHLESYNIVDINKAAIEQREDGKRGNILYVEQPLKYARTVAKREASFGNYNAVNIDNNIVPSKDKLNFNVTNATIRQVIKLFENGTFTGAGAYQFTPEIIEAAVELSGLSLDDQFSAVNQDKLFDAYFKKNGMTDYGEATDLEKTKIEDSYKNISQDTISSQFGVYAPYLVNSKALAYLEAEGFYG